MDGSRLRIFPIVRDRSFTDLNHKPNRSAENNRSSQIFVTKLSSLVENSDIRNTSHTARPSKSKERSSLPLSAITSRRSLASLKHARRDSPSRIILTTNESEREPLAEKRENQMKKFSLWQKVNETKVLLSRSYLAEDSKPYSMRSSLRKIFECLEMLIEADSTYGDLMSLITSTLKQAVYISPSILEMYNQLCEVLNSDELRMLLANSEKDGSIPCYLLLSVISKEVVRQNSAKAQRNKDDVIKIQALENILNSKDDVIQNLEKELEHRISAEQFLELKEEMNQINENCARLKQENERLQDKIKELVNKNDSLTKQVASCNEHIETSAAKIVDIEYEKEHLIQDLEKRQRQIAKLVSNIEYFKDFKDKAILRLSTVKETITKLQKDNDRLQNENRSLGLRAACGFEGLTPRPDYTKLQAESGIDVHMFYNPINNKLLPTIGIVENIVHILSDLRAGSEMKDLDISKRSPSKNSDTKRAKSNPKARSVKTDKHPNKSRPSIVVSTYKSFEPSTKPPTKALDNATPNINTYNSGERVDTLTSRRSNDPSIQYESFLTPNSARLDTSFNNGKYQVKVEALKEEEDVSIVDNNALEITNQLLGCVIEANKIFEHSFSEN